MDITNSIVNYRRFLKRRNYSPHTENNYLNQLRHFVLWVDVPIEGVTYHKVSAYIDHLLERRLKPKTINSHLQSIRGFYHYLYYEEEIKIANPVRTGSSLRVPKPLPRHLKDEEIGILFDAIESPRDRAIFKVMLRCGLRVEELANVTVGAIDLKRGRIFVHNGKGGKDRVVYISKDAHAVLLKYLRVRPKSRSKNVFLVDKGPYRGMPISVRGIQDLQGHNWISTTERYCTVSNLMVMRDYFRAMEVIMQRTPQGP